MTSQNIDFSSWDTLWAYMAFFLEKGSGASVMPEGTLDREMCDNCPAFPLRFQNRLRIHYFTNLHTVTLMMEAVCTSETPVTSPTSARCHNPGTKLRAMINSAKAESRWCVTFRITSEEAFTYLVSPAMWFRTVRWKFRDISA
jgi:hypothetical protein